MRVGTIMVGYLPAKALALKYLSHPNNVWYEFHEHPLQQINIT